MKRMTQLIVIAFVGISFLSLVTTPLWADHFKKLSKNHLRFGVSQLLVGHVSPRADELVRLMNPNHITQVAAALFYERLGAFSAGTLGTPEAFLGCVVRDLTPHAAVGIDNGSLSNPDRIPLYVEVISAPVTPVPVKKKQAPVADGLGIAASAGTFQGPLFLVHPKLFSLPDDEQAAIDCVCIALEPLILEGLAPNVFKDFGITCSEEEMETDHTDKE